ncbi:MAG: phage/plasmid primase, P4 family, partial [Actinobacteria bacterium]|nr:phage/plasmid primase, P4 family [Actinomycetota bacterium]
LSFARGRQVIVFFDGDLRANRAVYDGAALLAERLGVVGAADVRFVLLPTTSTEGIDDLLAGQPESVRRGMVERLIERSVTKLPKAPSHKRLHQFFDETGGLKVQTLTEAVISDHPIALTREDRVALYREGVYQVNDTALIALLSEKLGDLYRPSHRQTVAEFMTGTAYSLGLTLPDHPSDPLVNFTNGMLDLRTGELIDHDSSYQSTWQLPWCWDPDAVCPQYMDWLVAQIPDQIDDLEETAATMLDPTWPPIKAMFCYGPSRSGKGTFLHLMEKAAGSENRSAVTLHQLVTNKFSASRVYGKILNSAADLSAGHVEDLSLFKMLTGEDLIEAERKYGRQFMFVNQALFAFAANELPTVGETSRAYLERIKPFRFGNSFADHVDTTVSDRLGSEMPGILVRWVAALRRLRERGRHLPSHPDVMVEFERRSDRVRQWVAECCRIVHRVPSGGGGRNSDSLLPPGVLEGVEAETSPLEAVSPDMYLPPHCLTPRRELARAFNRWAVDHQAGSKMNERKILDRLSSIDGVYPVRSRAERGKEQRGLNVIVKPSDEWGSEALEALEAETEQSYLEKKVRSSSPTHSDGVVNGTSTPSEWVGDGVLSPGNLKDCVKTASGASTLPPAKTSVASTDRSGGVPDLVDGATTRGAPIVFDVETASVEDRYRRPAQEFFRIGGSVTDGEYVTDTDPTVLAQRVAGSRLVVGHNVISFDLPVLSAAAGNSLD